MSIVKERIVLRRRRREGERMPHRIKPDAVREGDSLLVEIVVGKDENLIYRYLFRPAQLFGRRGISFRESGNEIYWLSGLKPKILLQQQAEALLAQSDIRKERQGNIRMRDTHGPVILSWYSECTTRRSPYTVR